MPRDFRRARATDEEKMMEIHLENQMGVGGTASDTGYSVDSNNSGGLKCSFKSGQFLFLTSVYKENHNVFKSLLCK